MTVAPSCPDEHPGDDTDAGCTPLLDGIKRQTEDRDNEATQPEAEQAKDEGTARHSVSKMPGISLPSDSVDVEDVRDVHRITVGTRGR